MRKRRQRHSQKETSDSYRIQVKSTRSMKNVIYECMDKQTQIFLNYISCSNKCLFKEFSLDTMNGQSHPCADFAPLAQ